MPEKCTTLYKFLVTACSWLLLSACDDQERLTEASGIVVANNELLIVSDNSPGALFRYPLTTEGYSTNSGPRLAKIEIKNTLYEKYLTGKAKDLEGIGMLPNGELAFLSEDAAALFTRKGLLAQYPASMAEVAGRGLEGLAINSEGKIAALWEGGYYSPDTIDYTKNFSDKAQKPRLCVHTLPDALASPVCQNDVITLNVPLAPDTKQAFRAPELIWDTQGQGFIVLLSSQNAADNNFKYKWLQKFSSNGEPIGEPLNLCAKGYLPKKLRSKQGNYEGMAWFEAGKSVLIINDTNKIATAVVLSIEPWPSTDKIITCN